MLFAVTYAARGDVSEEREKRSLQLFTNWTPPAGYEFKAHYTLADGGGGIAIVEASTAAALTEGLAPWGPFFEFKTVPIVEIEEAVPMLQRVYGWRDSVR